MSYNAKLFGCIRAIAFRSFPTVVQAISHRVRGDLIRSHILRCIVFSFPSIEGYSYMFQNLCPTHCQCSPGKKCLQENKGCPGCKIPSWTASSTTAADALRHHRLVLHSGSLGSLSGWIGYVGYLLCLEWGIILRCCHGSESSRTTYVVRLSYVS